MAILDRKRAAILIADLSGLSKAEVERIWLPFAVWLNRLQRRTSLEGSSA